MITFLRTRPIVAAIGVSVLTVGIIGAALLTLTSAGCGLSHSGRCASHNLALLTTPSPTRLSTPTPLGGRNPNPTDQPTVPATNPASGPYPPYGPPASSGQYPPYNPPASSGPLSPNYNPASGVPFFPPSSSGGGSPYLPHALSCSLPVYAGSAGSGGFITFPGGTFIADPRSNVALPSPAGQAPPPGQFPQFLGYAYDRAYSKWVPVPVTWLSPDGRHYAFPWASTIVVVDVSSGLISDIGQGHTWSVIDLTNEGVYAGRSDVGGLWYLPFSAAPREITASGYWQAVSGNAAYGTVTSAVPQGAGNTILHLDLTTGATTPWFSKQGQQSIVAGLDRNGDPIIYVNQTVWIATGPQAARPILNGAYFNTSVTGTPVADANGVWFNAYSYVLGGGGIVLYNGTALYGMSVINGIVAGGCS